MAGGEEAESAPRLATLNQRRQRAVDQAEKALQRQVDEGEQELARHAEKMAEIKKRVAERQRKLDEARERLHLVMQQVGEAAAGDDGCDDGDDEHDNGAVEEKVRARAADARGRIHDAGSHLQEILGKLEAAGQTETCQHLNLLHQSLISVAEGIDGVERVAAGVVHYKLDSRAAEKPMVGAKGTTRAPAVAKAAGGAGGVVADANLKPAANLQPVVGKAASCAGGQPRDAATDAAAAADGASAAAAASADAAAPTVPTEVYYNGAASLDDEVHELRLAARQAVQQSLEKMANAPTGKDTDDAALLSAHQLVLASVGTPSNVVELRAFDRWRAALATFVVEEAAARAFNAGEAPPEWW